METRKRRADLALILILLAVSFTALGLFLLLGEQGAVAVVTVDGVEVGRYPLSESREVVIPSEGGGYNLLVLGEGQAYVREASCPDGLCAAHRPVSRTGESILCLPNRVAIRVEGGSQEEVDVIS